MLDLYEETLAIAKALQAERIPFAIIGGIGVSLHGLTRATEDIDLLVRAKDWPAIMSALGPVGFLDLSGPMHMKNVTIHRLVKIDGEDVLVCDFVESNGETEPALIAPALFPVSGVDLPVAPLPIIRILKQARMSDKDRIDIEGIDRLLRGEGPIT